MSESKILERVACAISGAPYPTKSSLRKARAAIEAMRELTPEMLDAAYAADAYWLHDTSEIRTEWNDEMSNVHRAIIDAALK